MCGMHIEFNPSMQVAIKGIIHLTAQIKVWIRYKHDTVVTQRSEDRIRTQGNCIFVQN